MTDTVFCPNCREQLDIPDTFRGKPVRCGNCQTVFTTPDPSAADDPPTLPARARRVDDPAPRWQTERPSRARRVYDDDGPPPRKSNLGVWALLLLTFLAVGGCCGGVVGLLAWGFNPTFTPYTSKEGKFKVEFPSEGPVNSSAPAPGEAGGVILASAGRPFGQEHYQVKCYDLKAEWQKLPPEKALEEVAAAEVNVLGFKPRTDAGPGEEVRRQTTWHSNFHALDVHAGRGQGVNRRETLVRCILVGPKVYVLSVQGQNTEPQFWWVQKFFVSFDLIDAPPPPDRNADPEDKKDDEKKKDEKKKREE